MAMKAKKTGVVLRGKYSDVVQYEYRGKLYQYCPYGGWGKLPVVFSDSYPVIIADKTETSCTAYFPEWYI